MLAKDHVQVMRVAPIEPALAAVAENDVRTSESGSASCCAAVTNLSVPSPQPTRALNNPITPIAILLVRMPIPAPAWGSSP